MSDLYKNFNFHDKTFETVIRSVTDNAEVTEDPEDIFTRGDKKPKSVLEHENKTRKEVGLKPLRFKPYFKPISTWHTDVEDWLSRFGANRLKQAIQDGAAMGMASNIHGHDPVPGYMYGLEFGEKKPY